MEKCKELFRKYKELILYVFFGGLTTVVNWVGYWLLADLLHVPTCGPPPSPRLPPSCSPM